MTTPIAPDPKAHLEMIQGVIDRLAGNSFAVKGWTLGILAAVVALLGAGGRDAAWFALVPTLACWALDGYYLAEERAYRDLHDAVRLAKDGVEPFSMQTKAFRGEKAQWQFAVLSGSVVAVHVPVLFAVVAFVKFG